MICTLLHGTPFAQLRLHMICTLLHGTPFAWYWVLVTLAVCAS